MATKQKHRHVIEATITCTMPFDPNDLESALIIQKQFQGTAKTLVGFKAVTTRMTKEPIPAEPKDDMPEIPAALKRTA